MLTLIAIYAILTRPSGDRPYTINAAILGSTESVDYAALDAFKQKIETQSAGTIRVNIYPFGQFCSNEKECIDGLKSGALDIFFTAASAVGIIFEGAQVLDLPYAFASDEVAQCVLTGPFEDKLRSAILADGVGIRLAAVTGIGGWRHFATTKKPVRTPDDLRGMKIRTTPSAIQQQLVRALGANPTPIAWSELYTAFGTGVIEGTKNTINDIVISNNDEHINFITLDGHVYMSGLWWYSERNWKVMPETTRGWVNEGIAALRQTTVDLPPKISAGYAQDFIDGGGTFIELEEEELALFKQAASSVRVWFGEQYGDQWLNELDAAVNACNT